MVDEPDKKLVDEKPKEEGENQQQFRGAFLFDPELLMIATFGSLTDEVD